MLAREREIHALKAQIEALQARVEAHGRELEELKTRKADAERARDDAQRELYVTHRRVAELAGQLQSQRGKIETAQARLARIEQEAERAAKGFACWTQFVAMTFCQLAHADSLREICCSATIRTPG